jgi:rhodanese-related sulfurtransferase
MKEYDIETLEAKVQAGDLLVDVRTPEERVDPGHVANSVNIATHENKAEGRLPRWDAFVEEFKAAYPNKGQYAILMCRSGGRSSDAIKRLESEGYTELVNATGGMMAWQAASKPMAASSS